MMNESRKNFASCEVLKNISAILTNFFQNVKIVISKDV